MSEYLVDVKGVKKLYRMGRVDFWALNGVDIAIGEGELVSLIGQSGSGKTTLLNIIGSLDRPSEGDVLIDGVSLLTLKDKQLTEFRARKIGFVFQFFNLIPTLSALENVELPMRIVRKSSDEAREVALQLLDAVGLRNKADNRPVELSGGEQQRVAIARSLANNPAILLADEPTGNLDSKTAADILSLLKRINKERDQTIICATHSPEIESIWSHSIKIRDGIIEKAAIP